MHTRRRSLFACVLFAALLSPLTARAQLTREHAILPSQPIALSWDASTPQSSLAEDQVASYELAAFDVVQTGTGTKVAVKTWNVGTNLSYSIPAAEVPVTPRPLYFSVRAISVAGLKSAHSNTLGFRDPSAPGAPANLRRPTAQ